MVRSKAAHHEAYSSSLATFSILSRFLHFAVGLAAALGKLHRQGLIRKDIKPANVLVDSATGAVRLSGFGIASRAARMAAGRTA